MAGRLLLIAALALLAVALPAAADGSPDSPPPAAPSDPNPSSSDAAEAGPWWTAPAAPAWSCLDSALVCLALPPTPANEAPTAIATCQLAATDPSSPWSLVVADPDGCWRNFVRRTIGWNDAAVEWTQDNLLPFP
jgi:hypothetical protein